MPYVHLEYIDLETDDLIEELESRGFTVSESKELPDFAVNKIHDFYQDYILWKQFGMKDSNFEKIADNFFSETLDIVIA